MTRYTADFRISLTVSFEDDGENAIIDQAFEAVVERLASVSSEADVEGIELVHIGEMITTEPKGTDPK